LSRPPGGRTFFSSIAARVDVNEAFKEKMCKVREHPKFLCCAEVEDMTGLSRSTIYRQIPKGEFPAPYQLSAGRVGWKEAEVEDWIERRKRANSWNCADDPDPDRPLQ
jgi:prophage regulatory protein